MSKKKKNKANKIGKAITYVGGGAASLVAVAVASPALGGVGVIVIGGSELAAALGLGAGATGIIGKVIDKIGDAFDDDNTDDEDN